MTFHRPQLFMEYAFLLTQQAINTLVQIYCAIEIEATKYPLHSAWLCQMANFL